MCLRIKFCQDLGEPSCQNRCTLMYRYHVPNLMYRKSKVCFKYKIRHLYLVTSGNSFTWMSITEQKVKSVPKIKKTAKRTFLSRDVRAGRPDEESPFRTLFRPPVNLEGRKHGQNNANIPQ